MELPVPRWFPDRPVYLPLLAFLAAAGCGGSSSPAPDPTAPIFSDPVVKLAETADASFTWTIYQEAVALKPLLAAPGTQVHMGYWSGSGNRDRLAALLNDVNAPPPGAPPRWAVWDEGASTAEADRYPAYVVMNQEYWYERAQAEVGGYDTLQVGGVTYVDPYPVTYEQADLIWGQFSDRYGETAANYHRTTGNVVQVWALVHGASPTRVFFHYECPKLNTLAFWGHVRVNCARRADASWQVAADWCDCAATCTPCPPAP